MPDLTLVVPVYNEADNIRPAIERLESALQGTDHDVLVVYDFDEDTTVPVVRELQRTYPALRLHRNDVGRGVLNAMRSGIAASRSPFVLITMADLSDQPEDIPRMLELGKAGADVVAGSRYMRGGRQHGGPLVKRTLSRLAGLSLHYLGGVPTHDATNNFKLYSRRLLDQVTIESQAGFELALELTTKAYLKGMRIAELPTTWRDRTAGESRFQVRKWLPHYLRWYWPALMGRFRRRG